MTAPRLVALKCPKCEAPLTAHAGELLFACPKCPTAVEASETPGWCCAARCASRPAIDRGGSSVAPPCAS